MNMLMTFISLLLRDAAFLVLLALIVVPLCVWKRATFAVLKRNFVGYFSNPTGYVFLCLFVLLTSIAAFWPPEFFNANLANLAQLNQFVPYIMLVFIPAITMSIWAEERRQGTDELLLTLPAGDFDIVVGKYLAAAAIFTASLLFSQLSSFGVLASLTIGDFDVGLFFATYLGYWFMGMAMLSVGMMASFLTSNLTVGFILGALLNAPLVFAVRADAIIGSPVLERLVSSWSLAAQFDDFGRGVISVGSAIYFAFLVVLGLYLSMVLIGSRHWSGGRDGTSLLGHYLVRGLSLLVIALGVNYVFANSYMLSRARHDMTEGKLSSLSPDTIEILRNLESEHAIKVEAFVSARVPDVYARTKSDLLSKLKEFRAISASDISVVIHELDQEGENAIEIQTLAEERYGIEPEMVTTRSGGQIKDEDVFLAAAFTSGLEKVVVPFFDYGIPVEYELIRSICTVANQERKTVGIVNTEARVMGGWDFAGGNPQNIPKQEFVIELEKQYDVEAIDPSQPIDIDAYDVMIGVQLSSLGPEELENVKDAVAAGLPTAIFEDPRPWFMRAPATSDPKMAPGGGMMGGGGPQPKGDIQSLWRMLGIEVPGKTGMSMGMGPPSFEPDLVWHRFMPYKKLQVQGIPNEWVFCRNDAPEAEEAINQQSPITSGLEELFFAVPGAIEPSLDSDLEFTPLASTGRLAGTISFSDFMQYRGNPFMLQAKEAESDNKGIQHIAAHIRELMDDDEAAADEEAAEDDSEDIEEESAESGEGPAEDGEDAAEEAGEADAEEDTPKRGINVVYVADMDVMFGAFLRIRARPGEDQDIAWQFENVDFLLNTVDVLAGEETFLNIRKRKPRHSTLRLVDQQTEMLQQSEFEAEMKFEQEYREEVKKINDELEAKRTEAQEKLQELEEQRREEGQGGVRLEDLIEAQQALNIQTQLMQQRLENQEKRLEAEFEENVKRLRMQTESEVRSIKHWYKGLAVMIPPIPPLLIGLIVFVRRRLREREGVSRSRLR